MSSSRKTQVKTLLIDADSGVYACGFMAQQKTHYVIHVPTNKVVVTDRDKRKVNKWLKEQDTYPADELELDFAVDVDTEDQCRIGVRKWIKGLDETLQCDNKIVYLTKGGKDFRSMLATIQRYKGNRMDLAKPIHYDFIRNYLIDYHDAYVFEYWEADDAVCMTMERGKENGKYYILSAIDKDLDQMPGRRYNPNRNGKKWKEAEKARREKEGDTTPVVDEGVYVIDEFDGWYKFYIQMLMGDATDNIKGLSEPRGSGVKSIGIKGAEKILHGCETVEEMCERVWKAYQQRYPAPVELIPWWWQEKLDEDSGEYVYLFDDEEAELYREQGHPYYEDDKVIEADASYFFFENADLLYMLRSPTDYYKAHIEIPNAPDYPEGIVAEFTDFDPNEE